MALSDDIWTYTGGQWQAGNQPILGAADHATWLGTLVFDGARRFSGVAPDLSRHCDRLVNSCLAMGLKSPVSGAQITALCEQGMDKFSPEKSLYIRPMAWSVQGVANAVGADADSTAFAICIEAVDMAPAQSSQTLGTTRFCRPSMAQATVNAKAACLYPNNGRMLAEVNSKGFSNALVCDPLGNVAETATSNLFMVRNGVVMTPVPNGTFLNGITRQRVIKLLREAGREILETTLSVDDFLAADEIFTTGNMAKVVPVTQLESRELAIGPVAEQARALYWQWAEA